MTPPIPATESSLPANDPDEAPHRTVTLGRVAAVAVLVATTLMWIYVFANEKDYHPAGWLKDRTFPTAAEAACKPFARQLAALPPASTARNASERADLVDRGTAIIGQMQAALRPLVPPGAAGKPITEWVDDWSTHIHDREAFSAKLRSDRGAEFMETTRGNAQLSTVRPLRRGQQDAELCHRGGRGLIGTIRPRAARASRLSPGSGS